MKVLVVDDEPLARLRLQRLLADAPDCEVVAAVANGREGIAAAASLHPDVVLLDIRMPGVGGIEAARRMAELDPAPAVVFCTAYDEHALEAFSARAIDYLLKPVTREALLAALERARQLNAAQLSALNTLSPGADLLTGRSGNDLVAMPADSVVALVADHKYVTAYGDDGRELLLDDSLKQLEQRLGPRFVRVHRNALVASAALRGLQRAGTGWCVRCEGLKQALPVSRRLLPTLKQHLRARGLA